MLAVEGKEINKFFRTAVFEKKHVLKDVCLSVEEGVIYGVLGPNGAGKTTLISIFSTLLTPDSGSVRIFGMDAAENAGKIREAINISTGNPNFPWSLSVYENLRYYSMLYGMPKSENEKAISEAVELLELEQHLFTKFEALSTGMKQRLSLAKALLNKPKLLFLDEPTVGLDPDVSIKIRKRIGAIQKEWGITILLTTHHMREAEQLCKRIAFIKEGRIIADATPGELKKSLKGRDVIAIHYEGEADVAKIRSIRGVGDVVEEEGYLKITVESAEAALDSILKSFGARIKNIQVKEPDLEDVFVEFAK